MAENSSSAPRHFYISSEMLFFGKTVVLSDQNLKKVSLHVNILIAYLHLSEDKFEIQL